MQSRIERVDVQFSGYTQILSICLHRLDELQYLWTLEQTNEIHLLRQSYYDHLCFVRAYRVDITRARMFCLVFKHFQQNYQRNW